MAQNEGRIDDMVLALLYLTSFHQGGEVRAWKAHDWDALQRLHEKGLISDPKRRSKSVAMSEVGASKAKELFEQYFLRDS